MNHEWNVKQDGNVIGVVEAVSRKGAEHEAYGKFGIEHAKQRTISVERSMVLEEQDDG